MRFWNVQTRHISIPNTPGNRDPDIAARQLSVVFKPLFFFFTLITKQFILHQKYSVAATIKEYKQAAQGAFCSWHHGQCYMYGGLRVHNTTFNKSKFVKILICFVLSHFYLLHFSLFLALYSCLSALVLSCFPLNYCCVVHS